MQSTAAACPTTGNESDGAALSPLRSGSKRMPRGRRRAADGRRPARHGNKRNDDRADCEHHESNGDRRTGIRPVRWFRSRPILRRRRDDSSALDCGQASSSASCISRALLQRSFLSKARARSRRPRGPPGSQGRPTEEASPPGSPRKPRASRRWQVFVDIALRQEPEHRGPHRPDVGACVDFLRSPERLFGGRKAGVPRTARRGSSAGDPGVPECNNCAIPKSSTLRAPSRVRKRLSGLMSR